MRGKIINLLRHERVHSLALSGWRCLQQETNSIHLKREKSGRVNAHHYPQDTQHQDEFHSTLEM